ncbi:uncharacterized protein FIBRA_03028 [Fibroporia radiculosa]|uniref:Major facilitator superfamily (MFS) profile domain-containing protein n=1 Tax=Fibroporia radiculosa TaxID=599839 RepID=J4GN91_9APHY|nr:uncharacterized protein FIBRA_03028 [Fibroporia radiculosa]CCM00980.1 predicted protein [Fibroporia radiculosa]
MDGDAPMLRGCGPDGAGSARGRDVHAGPFEGPPLASASGWEYQASLFHVSSPLFTLFPPPPPASMAKWRPRFSSVSTADPVQFEGSATKHTTTTARFPVPASRCDRLCSYIFTACFRKFLSVPTYMQSPFSPDPLASVHSLPPPWPSTFSKSPSPFSLHVSYFPEFPRANLRPIVTEIDVELSDQRSAPIPDGPPIEYRMYKRRWIGVVAIFILNLVSGLSLVWFGPIANDGASHLMSTIFASPNPKSLAAFTRLYRRRALPMDFSTVPSLPWHLQVTDFGFALIITCTAYVMSYASCYIGGVLLLASAWVRYAGTASGLPMGGAYALLLIGQLLAGITQPIFQVLIPGYSEKWFDLKSRTTATMLMSIANPIGNGLGQLISPLVGSPSQSVLVMGIIYTAAAPFVFIVTDSPPTPPTHSASQKSPSFMSLIRAVMGREPDDLPTYMTKRQRFDFVAISFAFGVLVGVINAFSILSAQIMEPYGYSDTISGLMGAALLLVGIVAALITAPLFDRVFTHHLAPTCKLLCPILGGAWLSLIWAVRRNNTGALFALMAVIGATSLTLLPVALELAVELTRNADGSSAMLWATSNLLGIVFVLSEGSLRAGADANPSYNMYKALIFQGVFVCTVTAFMVFVEGKQTRRALDEQAQREAQIAETPRTPARGRFSSAVDRDHGSSRGKSRSPSRSRSGSAEDFGEDKVTLEVSRTPSRTKLETSSDDDKAVS